MMNKTTKTAIGIDLGGTRIKAIALDASGKQSFEISQPTYDGDDHLWKDAVAFTLQEMQHKLGKKEFLIGIAAPGLPNSDNSAISFMPGRLKGLENFNWSDFLQSKTFVINDAMAALIAEARYGAAKEKKHIVMLTLGTGVGGAILINGEPYQGAFNKAGHIGHMVINDSGEPDICGMPGSLEDAIGNASIEKRSGGLFSTTRGLLEAYRDGDPKAAQIWLDSVRKLAIGLSSLTNILSPELIVLGGGITEAGKDLFDNLKKFMDQYEWRTDNNQAEIVKAHFGDMAGAIGAACFALEKARGKE
jgi:glucokinase